MSEVTKEITGTKTKEIKENEKSPCLYLSPARKSGYSPSIILTKLESLGFIVNQESSTTVAANLCFSIRMALIVLEDCEEKAFIEAIKSPKSCNEHTPIVFISSGPLSDVVRDLIQEQFIDELVFKCLTLECDLGSAVARLIRQPGQFAVTPKTKRPAIASKRKFQGSFPYLKKTCLGKSSTGEQDSAENLQGHAWNSHPCRASTAVKSENAEPSINGEHIKLDSVIHCSGETDAGPKRDNGLSTKGKTVKLDNNSLGMGSAASLVSLSLGRKNHNSIWMTASQKSSSAACSTALERKEQHLDKEKKRRERITKSWCWLRQLMPNCDSYADKATVFEMSVAYLHHCWKYHCSILQQVNEEFVLLNANNVLSEDMERKVIQVLEKERKVIGCIVESSTG